MMPLTLPALPESLASVDLPEHDVAAPATTIQITAATAAFLTMAGPPRKKCPRAITTGHRGALRAAQALEFVALSTAKPCVRKKVVVDVDFALARSSRV
jgi:hypothetical protein